MAVNYCKNIAQVTKKIAELTNTKPDRVFWKVHCDKLRNSRDLRREIPYRDKNGEPVTVSIGYYGDVWEVDVEYSQLNTGTA